MYILVIILAIIILGSILIYNGLIGKKNKVEYAFSSIDVMLKKRHDLIPNLVNTVKAFMDHEKSLLTKIVELRNLVNKPDLTNKERFDLEGQLTSALGRMNIQVENYPQLRSNENFLQLQSSLNEVEEQISAARRAYNASIYQYNNSVEMFPSSIFARMMGYEVEPSFEISEEESGNITVFGD